MLSLDKFQPHYYTVNADVYSQHIPIKPTVMPYDTLFHIIYHTLHNTDPFYKYNEKMEKILLLDKLEPLTIKYKSKIIDDLYNKRISLYTVSFISHIYKLNIVWYTSKCYVKFIQNNKLILYIYMDKEVEPVVTDGSVVTDGLYEIINIDKPLKSISSYKLEELIKLAIGLNINISVKKKKDIYENITAYFKDIKLI
tara:strand:+ start:175 stop:765 length:591 start_codon:yes stop_codon:yes gene_type:complete